MGFCTKSNDYHVESGGRLVFIVLGKINLSRSNDLFLFDSVNRVHRITCGWRVPGSNFHKGQFSLMACNDINFAQLAMEVPFHYAVSIGREVIYGNLFRPISSCPGVVWGIPSP